MVLFDGLEGSGKVNAGTPRAIVGAEILSAAHLLIAGMRRTAGSGDPDQGEEFGQAAAQFAGAEAIVAAAVPGDGWTGGAARAYADRNGRQADRAASMALLDRGVHTVIAREAQQISFHRENLDSQANHLATLRRATEAIALIPGVGHALKAAFELTAVNAALNTGAIEIRQLTREVEENAEALQKIADEYAVIAEQPIPTAESEAREFETPDRLDPGDSPAATRPPQF